MKTKLIIFISLFLISCDAESKFIGTWKGEKYMNQFFDDGTYIVTDFSNNTSYKQSWIVNDNVVTFTLSNGRPMVMEYRFKNNYLQFRDPTATSWDGANKYYKQ